ncbi:MmpL protein, partial [Mycobacterium sp. WUMAC-025]
SGDQTRAIPVPGHHSDDPDGTAAGEAANPRGQGENGDPARQRRRSGGGLSAADLLRREGRL